MKGILEFNLPEDNDEFKRATKALDLALALHDIDNDLLRPAMKHGYGDHELARLHKGVSEANEEIISEFMEVIRSRFYAILEHRGIDLDDILR